MANILYFGDSCSKSTSAQRASALTRLGHTVTIRNPFEVIRGGLLGYRWMEAFHYRTGYRFLQDQIVQWVEKIIRNTEPADLIWVDSGELLGLTALRILKAAGVPVVLYNVDDPTGQRDGLRFASLLLALPAYDLVVVVRKETAQECLERGVKQVRRLLRSYDELAHKPFTEAADIPGLFRSDVVFIGSWMRHENRDKFLLDLLKQGVPLAIWGNHWKKSPYWTELQVAYRGDALSGRDYVAAIQGAKICLGLLSKGNRDLHTTRSLEVPFAGGLLCAERTSEHQEIFDEGKEAVFWDDSIECARVCKELLADNIRRENIRMTGTQKVRALRVGHEDVCQQILSEFNIQ